MNGLDVKGKTLYESQYMRWDRVPTHIPHVFIEFIKVNGHSVMILNDELGGFDMDTQSDSARYEIIECVFPEVKKRGYRIAGSIEIDNEELNLINL